MMNQLGHPAHAKRIVEAAARALSPDAFFEDHEDDARAVLDSIVALVAEELLAEVRRNGAITKSITKREASRIAGALLGTAK